MWRPGVFQEELYSHGVCAKHFLHLTTAESAVFSRCLSGEDLAPPSLAACSTSDIVTAARLPPAKFDFAKQFMDPQKKGSRAQHTDHHLTMGVTAVYLFVQFTGYEVHPLPPDLDRTYIVDHLVFCANTERHLAVPVVCDGADVVQRVRGKPLLGKY